MKHRAGGTRLRLWRNAWPTSHGERYRGGMRLSAVLHRAGMPYRLAGAVPLPTHFTTRDVFGGMLRTFVAWLPARTAAPHTPPPPAHTCTLPTPHHHLACPAALHTEGSSCGSSHALSAYSVLSMCMPSSHILYLDMLCFSVLLYILMCLALLPTYFLYANNTMHAATSPLTVPACAVLARHVAGRGAAGRYIRQRLRRLALARQNITSYVTLHWLYHSTCLPTFCRCLVLPLRIGGLPLPARILPPAHTHCAAPLPHAHALRAACV